MCTKGYFNWHLLGRVATPWDHNDPLYPVNSCFTQIFDHAKIILFVIISPEVAQNSLSIPGFQVCGHPDKPHAGHQSLVTLTFDIQSPPTEGPNTSSLWIWHKSVQRLTRYFAHKQKSHRQCQKQNLSSLRVVITLHSWAGHCNKLCTNTPHHIATVHTAATWKIAHFSRPCYRSTWCYVSVCLRGMLAYHDWTPERIPLVFTVRGLPHSSGAFRWMSLYSPC